MRGLSVAVLSVVMASSALHAQETAPQQAVTLSPEELIAFADGARAANDFVLAERAYRALAGNPDLEIRTEARFRLGMMLADDLKQWSDAAVEFRRILDDKPNAARVRLELARMQAMLGNLGAARRELRAAEASGLPPEVDRLIRFYAGSLRERKRVGASIEVALAPDSNINRATRANTLGTVIGDFTLDDDAKARSGVGLSLRGQSYWREELTPGTQLLVQLSGNANLYRSGRFNDIAMALQAGPEFVSGKNRMQIAAGPMWRWYGQRLYSSGVGMNANWQHPVGKRAQLRLGVGLDTTNNRRNDLQDGETYSLSASFDRAFSARFGGGAQIFGSRDDARDPGYATITGGLSLYAFREMGRTTLVVSAGYSRLEADKRLSLYPERRIDDRFTASVAGTFRSLRVGPFAPLARVRWERNASRVEIYDFKRIAAEMGIASAF